MAAQNKPDDQAGGVAVAPKCVNCGLVEARNHCPKCGGCKVSNSHSFSCPRNPDNQRSR
ncbi:hypothetical protein [Saccharothrix obliqua]|uniref:hypothetical protein n=1 Tax=Saccharothrix obliqua TaxID=2861747 RepID=UPI001C5DFE5C|nr:hypothetical protein [Saccharothrix obliqua]MBW4717417.1 hypothetical protein [Saccharothrix obliqua]